MMPKKATAVIILAVFVSVSSIPHGLTAGDDTTLVADGSNDDIDTGTCFYSVSSSIPKSSSSSLSSPAPAPLPPRPPPPRSSSSSSFLFTVVWAFTLVGMILRNAHVLFTVVGMILRNAHVANTCKYAVVFLMALAFFSMMGPFVPDHFAWTVWAAAGILLLSFVYSIARGS